MAEYIKTFPKEVRTILEKMRRTIREAVPAAEEGISYGMPVFKLNGNLVYFGAFKNHIGFFPTASGIEAFKQELSAYEGSKGTVRFPFDEPIPFDLVKKIVKFRVKENLAKSKKAAAWKTCSRGHKYQGSRCTVCWKGARK